MDRHNLLMLLCSMDRDNIVLAQQFMKAYVETDDQLHTEHERANECNKVVMLWFRHLIEQHWQQIRSRYRARSYDFNYIFEVKGGYNLVLGLTYPSFKYDANQFDGQIIFSTAIAERAHGHRLMARLETELEYRHKEASLDAGGTLYVPESLTLYEDDGRYYKNNPYYQLLQHYL